SLSLCALVSGPLSLRSSAKCVYGCRYPPSSLSLFFFFNDPATTEIYTLSLHDALPIFKKSFTSFSHSTRNKTRDGLIRVRNIRALNGRFNTSITHAYSIVIGSKHITLNATGGGFLTASKQFRHGATS